ncbi:MAG: hypothetical protein HC888_05375 [Candidatus Competibacteraceae bacterium]|nr:hypothetical protein [Candidatus Competibacteraceae bacterium]
MMPPTQYLTKDGRPIKLRVFRYAEDRGLKDLWVLHKVVAYLDGKARGYLKIAYVPSRKFFVECPDI